MKKELQALGLTKNEVLVYLSTLELGPSSITRIATKANIQRSQIYGILEQLLNKKLVSISINGKRKIYSAESPEKLQLLLKEKLSMLDDILPELLTLSHNSDVKPVMRYVEGLEGIKDVYLASAAAKEKELYAFVGVESLTQRSEALNHFWDGVFLKKRKKNGVHGKVIIPDNAAGKAFRKKDAVSQRESKMVPASNYNFSAEVLIYDDVVAFISYTKNEEFAVSIKSTAIASTAKMIWHIVWNVSY